MAQRASWWYRIVVGATLAAALAGIAQGQRLTVVSSADAEAYRLAASGLARLDATVETFYLGTDAEQVIVSALTRSGRDTAIVALGGAAATLVARTKLPPNVHTVNCMMLGPPPARPGGPIHVPLDIPNDTQGAWIQRLVPGARTVGILFDPVQNEQRAADTATALKRLGFDVVLEPVSGPAALPGALQRMQNHADVLQALPDTVVFAPEHARALLMFSFRQQIPLVGPTEPWVKAGALFAVDWDYQDLGRYCGGLALRQLSGSKATLPPPRTRVVANARSAGLLRLTWDEKALRLIDKIYKE